MGKVAKVPVVMQMDAVECGAACLCMILAHYGKWVPLEKVREDCGVSRDGSNAKHILVAARNYGMEAAGYKFEINEITQIEYPCIIHWNLQHYVVLCGFKHGNAIINDPAKGNLTVSMREFDRSFTGIALLFTPTPAFVADGKQSSVYAFAKERLKGSLMPMLFIMLVALMLAIIGVINPALSKVFIDNVLSGTHTDWAGPVLWIMVGFFIIYTILSALQSINLLKVQGKMSITSSTTFFWHMLHLPMTFFAQRYPGDLVSRQSSNESIVNTLIAIITPIFVNAVMVIIYIVVMLKYSILLTCIAVASALCNIFLLEMISEKRLNITRRQMINRGNLSSVTVSGIDMIETIKSSGAEDVYFERWSGLHAADNNASVTSTMINQVLGVTPELIQQLISAVILIIGAYMIMNGEFTIGLLLAFQGFMSSMLHPFTSLLEVGHQFQEMRSSMERVEDVMRYNTDTDISLSATEEIQTKLKGEVELKHLTFGYSRLSEPVINDLSIKIPRGSRVAIV